MGKNNKSIGRIRKEIQTKLFLKFLKKEKQYDKYIKTILQNPSKKIYFNGSMYDYIFVFHDYSWTYSQEIRWRNLRNKWYNIVNNYKKIKKSNYKIYGK
jgi:hypothetical protein